MRPATPARAAETPKVRPAPAVTTAVGVGTEPVTLNDMSVYFSSINERTQKGSSTYVPLPPDGGGTPNPAEGEGGTPVAQGTCTVS